MPRALPVALPGAFRRSIASVLLALALLADRFYDHPSGKLPVFGQTAQPT
jgi:hypothetical protein